MNARLARELGRAVRWNRDCGLYVNDGRLRTEIVLPNPAVAPLTERLGRKAVLLTFYDPEGRVVRRRVTTVALGATRVIDVARLGRLPRFGQVQIVYASRAGQARGGNRTVFHWYYPGGMTLVHEKREPRPSRGLPRAGSLRSGQGYMTLFGIPGASSLDLHLACVSQDRVPAEVRLRCFAGHGAELVSPPITVAPRGTAFFNVRDVVGDRPRLLEGPIALDALPYALSYFYFVHNRDEGTWQAQHL